MDETATHDLVCCVSIDALVREHEKHHFGVERTLYLARKWDSLVSRQDVERVVRECKECNNIDPWSMRVPTGELGVRETWMRVSMDVVHVQGKDICRWWIVDLGGTRCGKS